MNVIRFLPDETQVPPPGKIAEAARLVETDGYVVLEDVVNPEHLRSLATRMLEELPRILSRSDAPFNFNDTNVQQDPPPFPPFLHRDILCNEVAIAVTHAVLGDGVRNGFYSGNTALPGGKMQPVHADVGQLWPNLETAPPAFGLVVNIPVVDMGPWNGATELWPGTHRDTSQWIGGGPPRIPEDLLDRWRRAFPPFQPEMRAGSVLIRDIRMWHRGMPNPSGRPRPMIAMIHWSGWYECDRIRLPRSAAPFFEHAVLRTAAEWVEEPFDHTLHGSAYDFAPNGDNPNV